MARPLRIEFEGALYHVLGRANERKDVFRSDGDRSAFLNVLAEMGARFDVAVFAYVLMGNHYHVLLKTNRANLSKSMQWLGTTYTRRYNLSHFRSGHLLQGRFKSILVENDAYLTQLSCYIHANPLRAGLVERLVQYEWSSYKYYGYKRRVPSCLHTELILSQVSGADPRRSYRAKVQKYASEDRRLWEDLRYGVILGTRSYVDEIRARYLKGKTPSDQPQLSRILKDEDKARVLREAASMLDFDLNESKKRRRVLRKDRLNRDLLLYLLWETGLMSNGEIREVFGLAASSVSRRVDVTKSFLNEDKSLFNRYQEIKAITEV